MNAAHSMSHESLEQNDSQFTKSNNLYGNMPLNAETEHNHIHMRPVNFPSSSKS